MIIRMPATLNHSFLTLKPNPSPQTPALSDPITCALMFAVTFLK